ncbi:MAG: nitroreductase family protein [Candidatus Zhuqueibacterota bacterium]
MNSTLMSIMQARRSVRKYQDKPVEREKIVMCLEAARIAPSAENVQPWRFIVIDDPELKQEFSKQVFSGIYRATHFAANAPVIVVMLARLDILANKIGKQIQGISYYLIDTGIAGQHFVLRAQELGLGTCWIGWFNPRAVRKVLDIPRSYKVVSLMSLGYPLESSIKEKKRLSLNEIAWFNGFKQSLKLE